VAGAGAGGGKEREGEGKEGEEEEGEEDVKDKLAATLHIISSILVHSSGASGPRNSPPLRAKKTPSLYPGPATVTGSWAHSCGPQGLPGSFCMPGVAAEGGVMGWGFGRGAWRTPRGARGTRGPSWGPPAVHCQQAEGGDLQGDCGRVAKAARVEWSPDAFPGGA